METLVKQSESANLSEDQLFRLCAENKKLRIERDKNKNIIIMSPTGFLTENFNSEILGELRDWNKKNKSGYVTGSSGGYYLPNGSMRAPDVAWTKKERIDKLSQKEKEKFPHICPDFVIEVRSKSDTLKQQKEKMTEWIENGCQLAWLIDLEHKTTHIYKPGAETTEQAFTKVLNGDTVLTGFKLKLSEII
ncbi:MAG: Uma2 family endonuclease [Bacteroidia bacterium]|nr:Uma2 family endonuclease [Bacteroidia bacterium]